MLKIEINVPRIARISTLAACMVMHAAGFAQTTVSKWTHAGPGPERDVYMASVKAFNAAHKDMQIDNKGYPAK